MGFVSKRTAKIYASRVSVILTLDLKAEALTSYVVNTQ